MASHTDPICGMKVDDKSAAGQSTFGEKIYYFCGQGCKKKFDQNPQQHASQKAGS